jgi:PRTRC genetic system protein B
LKDAPAAHVQPRLVLAFYDGGVVLQKATSDAGTTAYPVDPAQVQQAFARAPVCSPILPANVLCWARVRGGDAFAWWRPPAPEKVLIEVDHVTHEWAVPLPGLVIVCADRRLGLAALRGNARPEAATQVFSAPFPNTGTVSGGGFRSRGDVCLGSARLPKSIGPNSFDAVWRAYIGSTFNSHMAEGKSASHPDDVRALLLRLHEQGGEVFPEEELVAQVSIHLEEFIGSWLKPD